MNYISGISNIKSINEIIKDIEELKAHKQDKEDTRLHTYSKNIVNAINEIIKPLIHFETKKPPVEGTTSDDKVFNICDLYIHKDVNADAVYTYICTNVIKSESNLSYSWLKISEVQGIFSIPEENN